MRFKLILYFVLFCNLTFSQINDSLILSVENHIINNDVDLALIDLSKIKNPSSYAQVLNRLLNNQHSYTELTLVLTTISEKHSKNINEINHFFRRRLKINPTKTLNVDFVKAKWKLVFFLLNSNKLSLAEEGYNELNEYLAHYNQTDINYNRATFYKNIYNVIIEIIREDIEKGTLLSMQNMEIAKSLKDTNLMVMSDYYYSDFLIYNKDLDGYIELSEQNIRLSKICNVLPENYYGHVFNLLDALIFKGGKDDEMLEQLNELYDVNSKLRIQTYSYYLQLVSKKNENELIVQTIFQKFEVDSMPQFCDKIISLSKDNIFNNDENVLYSISASALYNNKYYREALAMMQDFNNLTKQIYSKDMADALASAQVRGIKTQKKYELELEKQKTQQQYIYFIFAITLLGFTIVFILFQLKKNKTLKTQKESLTKKDGEKQLLLKEIHHRVKNNFQIVSSLLQLQTKDITDEKALSIVKEGQNRVKSMALIHQKLYQNDDLLIDFNDYVNELFKDLNKVYSNTKVECDISINPNYRLDIDTAMPLGLILNELITNAFKYAFKIDDVNKLTIELIEGQESNQLIVSDNGEGVSKSIDLNKTKSIGLKLVKSLAKQLHGKAEFENENGTKFTISFKETFERELLD